MVHLTCNPVKPKKRTSANKIRHLMNRPAATLDRNLYDGGAKTSPGPPSALVQAGPIAIVCLRNSPGEVPEWPIGRHWKCRVP